MTAPLAILVQPRSNDGEYTYVPLALLHVAAALRPRYRPVILDCRLHADAQERLTSLLRHEKVLAVGFSVLTGAPVGHALELSRTVREISPGTRIVWGGIHPSLLPEQTLAGADIDAVVIGEGEDTLPELLDAWRDGRRPDGVRGVAFRGPDGAIVRGPERPFVDMKNLPLPAWDLIEPETYVKLLSSDGGTDRPLNLNTSRGCPYSCTFCYNVSFNQRRWRSRTAEQVVEEVEILVRRAGINRIIFHDDMFPTDRRRAIAIAQEIHRRGLRIRFSVDLRANWIKRDFIEPLRDCGLYQVRVGAESGSNRLLEHMKKGVTAEEILESAAEAKRCGIQPLYSFVMGWPTETEAERRRTVDLCFRLLRANPDTYIYPLWIYTPYPGTPMYEEAIALGFRPPSSLAEWAGYSWDRSHIPWVTDIARIEAMHVLGQFAFYNRRWRRLALGQNGGLARPRVLARRFGAMAVRQWARLRFKTDFWRCPFEARVLKKAMERVS